MSDDDEDFPPEGGCLGIGAVQTVSERSVRKVTKRHFGFVHFPDKPAVKAKRPRMKAKRRKR